MRTSFLLKEIFANHRVELDNEYDGRGGEIVGLIVGFLKNWKIDLSSDNVTIVNLGKNCLADKVAYGSVKPTKRIELTFVHRKIVLKHLKLV